MNPQDLPFRLNLDNELERLDGRTMGWRLVRNAPRLQDGRIPLTWRDAEGNVRHSYADTIISILDGEPTPQRVRVGKPFVPRGRLTPYQAGRVLSLPSNHDWKALAESYGVTVGHLHNLRSQARKALLT